MIDCNKTKNYLSERNRMCKRKGCNECSLGSYLNGTNKNCRVFENCYPDKAIEIVQKWSDKHPQKTLLTEFLKHYPKTELNFFGCPSIAPCELGIIKLKDECKDKAVYCFHCKKCWNTLVEESEETE